MEIFFSYFQTGLYCGLWSEISILSNPWQYISVEFDTEYNSYHSIKCNQNVVCKWRPFCLGLNVLKTANDIGLLIPAWLMALKGDLLLDKQGLLMNPETLMSRTQCHWLLAECRHSQSGIAWKWLVLSTRKFESSPLDAISSAVISILA